MHCICIIYTLYQYLYKVCYAKYLYMLSICDVYTHTIIWKRAALGLCKLSICKAYATHMPLGISRLTTAIYSRLLRVGVHLPYDLVAVSCICLAYAPHIRCMRSLKLNVAIDGYSVRAKVWYRRPSIGDHAQLSPTPIGVVLTSDASCTRWCARTKLLWGEHITNAR